MALTSTPSGTQKQPDPPRIFAPLKLNIRPRTITYYTMPDHQIQPHKVTKPIQLVAAWLTGLVLIDAMFLGAAASLDNQGWPHGLLVICAAVNVPIFLGAIFLLQTRFRAELQEDSFYSEYLSKRTSQVIKIDKNSEQDAKIESLELRLLTLEQSAPATIQTSGIEQGSPTPWGDWLVAVNGLHPQVDAILEALKASGIPVEEVFGQNESFPAPSRWVISVNYQIPTELQVKLLRSLMPFNFAGFDRWEPRRDAEEYEDVYIGGYGNDPIVRFTPKLKKLLTGPNAVTSLNAYYRSHSEA